MGADEGGDDIGCDCDVAWPDDGCEAAIEEA